LQFSFFVPILKVSYIWGQLL